MLGVVLASLYIPSLFAQPKTDFLYSMNDNNYGSHQVYVVQDNHVIKQEVPLPNYKYNYSYNLNVRLYLYDAEKDSSREIDIEEAKAFTLSTETRSPDGFELVNGSRGGDITGLFFGGGNYGGKYLKGNGVTKKISMPADDYYSRMSFLGWIIT